MTPSAAAASPGGSQAGLTPPDEFFYTGVHEIPFETQIDLTDWVPGAIREIRTSGMNLGSKGSLDRTLVIPRSLDILAAGAFFIPCMDTDSWADTTQGRADFQNYLADWCDAVDANADTPPLYWEVGNEPNGSPAVAVRDKYLRFFKAAYDVLHPRGHRCILGAQISDSGGTKALLDQIDGGGGSGSGQAQSVTWGMVDAMTVHTYNQQADKDNPYPSNSAFKNTGTKQSLYGMRNLFDNNAGYGTSYGTDHKPIFLTEFGWSCADRHNSTAFRSTDWSPGQPGMSNGSTGQENRVILEGEQSQQLKLAFDVVAAARGKKTPDAGGNGCYVLAATWFCSHDYGNPSGAWDRHCGLMDRNDGKRTAYQTLKGYRKQFPMIP